MVYFTKEVKKDGHRLQERGFFTLKGMVLSNGSCCVLGSEFWSGQEELKLDTP